MILEILTQESMQKSNMTEPALPVYMWPMSLYLIVHKCGRGLSGRIGVFKALNFFLDLVVRLPKTMTIV